jgi:hypothetical protein
MRCYICDAAIAEPQFNRDHEDWDPCLTCQTVINDMLNDTKDNVVWVEEDLPYSSQNPPHSFFT